MRYTERRQNLSGIKLWRSKTIWDSGNIQPAFCSSTCTFPMTRSVKTRTTSVPWNSQTPLPKFSHFAIVLILWLLTWHLILSGKSASSPKTEMMRRPLNLITSRWTTRVKLVYSLFTLLNYIVFSHILYAHFHTYEFLITINNERVLKK